MPRTSRKPRGSLETPSPPRATAFTHEGRRRAPPPSPRSRSEWRGGRLGALPRAGWGALPRGASLTIRRGCRWLPWPNRRNTLVALSPRPATPHPTPPRHSASPSGGREEREADMCESGSRKGEGRLGQVELWLAGAVAFLATFVASSSSPPFRCARRSRGKRWLKPLRKRGLCGSAARYRCHSGAPRSGEPGTHNHGGWTVAQSSQTRVFMGSGLALRAPRNDSEIAKSPFAEARKAGAINLRRVPPRCSPAGRGAR